MTFAKIVIHCLLIALFLTVLYMAAIFLFKVISYLATLAFYAGCIIVFGYIAISVLGSNNDPGGTSSK